MFLLTGSGHKNSTKKPRPVKAEVQAQEEMQFQAHQEAIKVTLTSVMPQEWARIECQFQVQFFLICKEFGNPFCFWPYPTERYIRICSPD